MAHSTPTTRHLLLFILLLAFALRVIALPATPPGLTHDEANHGWEALTVLDGRWLFYFPVGYGREPLYGYLLAGAMSLFGRSIFALRYLSSLANIIAIAATAAWAQKWLGRQPALLGAGFMAVSFWSVAIGRQLLRSSLIPLFITIAALCLWHMFAPRAPKGRLAVGLGIAIALMLYTYIAARVAWLFIPAFLAYLALTQWDKARPILLPTLAGLALGGLLSAPLFLHLAQNPTLETRVEMLSGTLDQLRAGNWEPLVRHVREGALALVWPGAGDAFLAYNLPGRPVLEGVTAVGFLLGLLLALGRWRQPAYPFLLLWLVVGLAPSLITGATANTTRNIAALPPLYLLAAVGWAFILRQTAVLGRSAPPLLGGLVLAWAGVSSGVAYFGVWGNQPEVRAAYQASLITAVEAINTHVPKGEAAVVSSVWPGPAHDPSIAQLVVDERTRPLRWVDGRLAMLFPLGQPAPLFAPASTPLHPLWLEWATAEQVIALRPTDLDPAVTHYTLTPPAWDTRPPLANFNDGLHLLSARWLAETTPPGGVAELLTVWQVVDPTQIGPITTPVLTTEASLFTHVLRPDGRILVQADRLDAPSWAWQAGDMFAQIHPFYIAPDVPPGVYEVLVGVYTPATGARLPRVGGGDSAVVPPLAVE